VFDGSGAALPPVATDRTIVVVAGHQDPAVATGYLNRYRLLLAQLAIVTMAEPVPGASWEAVRRAVAEAVRPGTPVVGVTLQPRPVEDVAGRSVAHFALHLRPPTAVSALPRPTVPAPFTSRAISPIVKSSIASSRASTPTCS
jgi:hypothetical protein